MSWTVLAKQSLDRLQTLSHKNYERVKSELLASVFFAEPGEVICLVGPSRVGKTRLIREVGELLGGNNPRKDSPYMPVVTTIAGIAGAHSSFSTKSFALKVLESVRHPILSPNGEGDRAMRPRTFSRTSESEYVSAYTECFKQRQVKYWFIDEAQQFLLLDGGIRKSHMFCEYLKTFAAETNIVLVLTGTYPLLSLVQSSPHTLGRKFQVHFPRYHSVNYDDVRAFEEILGALSGLLRFKDGTSLRDWNEYLFHGSMGCYGRLYRWIRSALAHAMVEQAQFLERRHFQSAAQSATEDETVLEEITQGERLLDAFRTPEEGSESAPHPEPNGPVKRTRKPFQRNPRRYSVASGAVS